MITPCPAPKHAHPGQPVELGTCIGYTIEPGDRLGRLVAIRHSDKETRPYIVRCYQDGDGAWPTGQHFSTRILVPHVSGGENDLLPIVHPSDLHAKQAAWYEAQTLAAHHRRLGNGHVEPAPNTSWPLIPMEVSA